MVGTGGVDGTKPMGGKIHTIYCRYKKRTVPASECEACEKKPECPSLFGW